MNDEFTVRYSGKGSRISRDDGASAELDPIEANQVAELGGRTRQWRFGGLTAAGLGTLGEVMAINPRTDLWHGYVESGSVSPGVRLPAPEHDGALRQLLARRMSERRMTGCAIGDLTYVLTTAYQVLASDVAPDGFQITHRPVPSAGARHPFTLVAACLAVEGIERGCYDFDPNRRELRARSTLAVVNDAVSSVKRVGRIEGEPGAVIFVVCDFARTLSRYPSGSALAWLDAGVLVFAMHVAGVEADLASCIVGTSGVLERAGPDHLRQDLVAIAFGRHLPDPSRA